VPAPIARYTTFDQFRDHLQFLGCGYGDLPLGFSRSPMVYFERTINGVLRDAVLKKRADDDEVTPTEIQGICVKLEIDLAEFGFQYP